MNHNGKLNNQRFKTKAHSSMKPDKVEAKFPDKKPKAPKPVHKPF